MNEKLCIIQGWRNRGDKGDSPDCSRSVKPYFNREEGPPHTYSPEMGTSAVVRVIEQCRFNSVPDPFNGQTVNLILKPLKVIESRFYVKKANLKHY